MMNRKTTWKLPALGVALTFFLCAPALAGKAQVPKTGQTECYDTYGTVMDCTDSGQDGAIQAGVAWPSPRFKDNADGSVTDKLTGLMWTKDANLMATRDPGWQPTNDTSTYPLGCVSPTLALEYVKKLNNELYLSHTDWRLPNIVELESLINTYIFSTAVSGNAPFTNFQETGYTSSTWLRTVSGGYVSIFGYSLGQPYIYTYTLLYNYVWPVRSAQTGKIQLPKTGQTKCYSPTAPSPYEIDCSGTGQDGETQIGVGWTETQNNGPCVSGRFLSNGSGTISDNMTGLEWSPPNIIASRDPGWDQDGTPGDGKVTWQHALDYIQKLNIEQYLGYSDWRLPNKQELESAAAYPDIAPPCGGPWGYTSYILFLWSSTTIPENKTLAYRMNANTNIAGFQVLVGEKRLPDGMVIAVRGGVLGDNGTDGGDCQLRVFPKTIHKILSKLKPTKLFLLIAKGSTLSDDDAIWDTSSIMSTNSHRISPRIRLFFTVINPFNLDVNEVKVTVGGCSGTVKVKAF